MKTVINENLIKSDKIYIYIYNSENLIISKNYHEQMVEPQSKPNFEKVDFNYIEKG